MTPPDGDTPEQTVVQRIDGRRPLGGKARLSLALAVAVVAGWSSVFVLEHLWPPYIFLSAIWAITCAYAAVINKRSPAQVALLSLASVFFVLGLYETYLFSQIVERRAGKSLIATDGAGNAREMSAPNDVLGYAPKPNQAGRFTLTHDGNPIFGHGYTIGPNGLRVSPPHEAVADVPCALFFGGSFTFGTGVEDDEAMPYVAGILSEGKVRVYNFGYRGYGPHQMLAALESGLVDSVIDCVPTVVIYQAIVGHMMRSVGLSDWDTHGPRYVLADTGEAIRRGNFDDFDNPLVGFLQGILKKSLTVMALGYGRYTNYKMDLMVAILDKSRNLVTERYPGSEFHVIFWDACATKEPEPVARILIDKIVRKNFQLHLVSTIVVDICAKVDEYMIQGDGHPNKTAHDKIARYVVREIFRD